MSALKSPNENRQQNMLENVGNTLNLPFSELTQQFHVFMAPRTLVRSRPLAAASASAKHTGRTREPIKKASARGFQWVSVHHVIHMS